MNSQRKIIGSVQRAIDILNLFDKQHAELGMTEIAQSLNMPKGTVAGLVYTLDQNNYLDQNPITRKYRLGFKLAERAGILLSQFDLREVAGPVLQDLRNTCNETVNLAVLDGGHVVYIERLLGTNMLGMRSEIGKREMIHSTALGKAILAWMSKEEVNNIIAQHEFKPITPHTITSPAAFMQELQKTYERGFAIDNEENELGGRCVAAPILDYDEKPVAAISISVPIQRFPDSHFNIFGLKVHQAARLVSRKLGSVVAA